MNLTFTCYFLLAYVSPISLINEMFLKIKKKKKIHEFESIKSAIDRIVCTIYFDLYKGF